jgi:hypothetical protein
MRHISIQIDAIVVDGVELNDPQAFQRAVADGLAERAGLHAGDYPHGIASTLCGSDIRVGEAEPFGRAVARSAWASMVSSGAPARRASPTQTAAGPSGDGGGR